jgi:integrase
MGLPDNGIDDDATACLAPGFYRGKGKDMPRYFGPYAHHGSWRIMVRSEGRQLVQCTYATEEEAKRALRRLRTEAAKQGGPTTEKAIEAHLARMRRNGVKERSIDTTGYRLRKLLAPVLAVPLGTVTPDRAKELFTALEGSIDTRRNILGQARTFFRAAKEAGWTAETLLADVKGEGRRHTGKQKLTVDEARKFLAACLKVADGDDPKRRTEGVASAMALVFGMRASEITGLQVRDLDAGGTIIRITHAKSQAGIRSLQVPDWFRPYLGKLATGKEATASLVGHNRTWLHRNVRAICRSAGITEAPPHGLRGTHADLALMAAATPLSVSKALGHASTAITFRHYADQGLAESQDHERAIESLAPLN